MAELVPVRSANDEFQRLEALLRSREKRQKAKAFVVEGVKPIELALAHGMRVRSFFYSRHRKLSLWAEDVLRRSAAERHLELEPELMVQLSDKHETSELMAVLAMPDDDLARIRPSACPLLVVVDRPSSPGNLGTLIRSCDSLGVEGVVVTGHAVDLYDPKTIRASVGTLFALPVVRVPSSQKLEPWLNELRRERHLCVVGTTAKTEQTIQHTDFRRPTVLLFGNETTGLSAHYRSLCDELVTIPIRGAASSLNVACAASIVLYEADRQRRAR